MFWTQIEKTHTMGSHCQNNTLTCAAGNPSKEIIQTFNPKREKSQACSLTTVSRAWCSYIFRLGSKELPTQIWMEQGRHRWWSREGTDRSSGLGYKVCTFRLLYSSYFKHCQVPAVPPLSKVLIHLVLLKEVEEEEDCANLTALWFRGDSHHLGSLSDLKCNILLSVNLCVCSFSVAVIVTSIFAKHKLKILQIQPKAVCYSCNTILMCINTQRVCRTGIFCFFPVFLFLLSLRIFFFLRRFKTDSVTQQQNPHFIYCMYIQT